MDIWEPHRKRLFLYCIYSAKKRKLSECCLRILCRGNMFSHTLPSNGHFLQYLFCCCVRVFQTLLRSGSTCHNNNYFVKSEVFAAVVKKRSIFWVITPCCPLKVNWCSSETSANFQRTTWHYITEDITLSSTIIRLEGNNCHQGRRCANQVRGKNSAENRALTACFLLLFSQHISKPEEWGSRFLRNVGEIILDYMA
jgi:hypothetical protein